MNTTKIFMAIGHAGVLAVSQIQTTTEDVATIVGVILLPLMMVRFVVIPVARNYGETVAAFGPLVVNVLWPVFCIGIVMIPAMYVPIYNHDRFVDGVPLWIKLALLVAWTICGLVGLYCISVFFALP